MKKFLMTALLLTAFATPALAGGPQPVNCRPGERIGYNRPDVGRPDIGRPDFKHHYSQRFVPQQRIYANGYYQPRWPQHETRPYITTIAIAPYDRAVIYSFLNDKFCRQFVCTFKRQGRVVYNAGDVVRGHANPLWQDLEAQLEPLPQGLRYVHIDDQVLLLSTRDRRVVDVISLNF